MTRLPRGSRLGSASARCDAPITATERGFMSGERSRQTMASDGSCVFIIIGNRGDRRSPLALFGPWSEWFGLEGAVTHLQVSLCPLSSAGFVERSAEFLVEHHVRRNR